jgi:hypothetical protein
MGKLQDNIDFQVFINGKDLAETYKNNTMMFYEAYKTSSKEIISIPLGKIQKGAFYFFNPVLFNKGIGRKKLGCLTLYNQRKTKERDN